MICYHGAQIKNGKLRFFNRDSKNQINSLPEGTYLVAVMSMNDKDNRDNQNRYFAQLGEWSLSTGWTKEDLHELVKEELFVDLFDEALSTTALDCEQWTMVFFQLENFLLRKFENK
jgi:hypothetical protein